jgi:hypothetical protein
LATIRATAITAITTPIFPAVRPRSERKRARNGKNAAMVNPYRMNSTCTAAAGPTWIRGRNTAER